MYPITITIKYTFFFSYEQFYKNTSLEIGAENNDLLFRTKGNLRTTKPWFLQKKSVLKVGNIKKSEKHIISGTSEKFVKL